MYELQEKTEEHCEYLKEAFPNVPILLIGTQGDHCDSENLGHVTSDQLIKVAKHCGLQAAVETSSVNQWQAQLPAKRAFNIAAKVMFEHENKGFEKIAVTRNKDNGFFLKPNPTWDLSQCWKDTYDIPVKGNGVYQISYLNEW